MNELALFNSLKRDDHFVQFVNSHKWPETKKMLTAAFLGVLTALLQSAGSLVPFVGLFISPFTTLPVIISIIISIRYGMLTYLLGILLLLMLEPTELFIYPFTTGILGIGLGICLRYMTNRLFIATINGCLLCIGICLPLYVLGLPVLGPLFRQFDIQAIAVIWLFSFVYSFLWIGLAVFFLRKLNQLFRNL